MSIVLILLIIALVLFVAAAAVVPSRINLEPRAMKDVLLDIGVAVGAILTLCGGGIQFVHADNSDSDALLAAVRIFIGLPALAVGVIILGLSIWGLAR